MNSTRRARLILAWIFVSFTTLFGVASFILYLNGGVSAADGIGLAIGGLVFGVAVGTSIVKPTDLGPVRGWFLGLLRFFSWGVAIAGFIVFAGIWVHFALSPNRSSVREAWKIGALALTILFAITPSAMTIDDWRSRLEEVRDQQLRADEVVDAQPNDIDDAKDAGGRHTPDDDLPAEP